MRDGGGHKTKSDRPKQKKRTGALIETDKERLGYIKLGQTSTFKNPVSTKKSNLKG